jgi:recombinational DNA repair ATPase RecF
MLNVTQLRERIATEFPDAVQVANTVVRFVRSANDRPYAICYVDIAEEFPRTRDDLTKYQDRVIGQHYFEGRKSLQWSNYLYFVMTSEQLRIPQVRRAKEFIEADRAYARKFVIAEDELEQVLSPSIVAATGGDQAASVLSVWTRQLVAANLDGAILNDADLPKRLEWIEASAGSGASPPPKPSRPSTPAPPPPFIRGLELSRYRPYPIQRRFEFGTVNLIFGPNAAGKTSLLEAIELYYCGRNKRSPDKSTRYDLTVVLADGTQEKAATGRRLQTFRDRNLAWYGRPEVKTNDLYQSFAQFNFLDADAAVNIAESTSDIENDLSKLLVGPDASKIWRNMERVSEALSGRLRDMGQLEANVNEERAALQARLEAIATVRHESDGLASRLDEMLDRFGWGRLDRSDRESGAAGLVSSLSELAAVAEQASALEWVSAPASLEGLATYCASASKMIADVGPTLARLETLAKERKRLEDVSRRASRAAGLAEQVRRLIEANVPGRYASRIELLNGLARHAAMLADLETLLLDARSQSDDGSLAARCRQAASDRRQAEQTLAQTKTQYANVTTLRDKSLNLAQQMRQIASEILKDSPAPDECPLCHTRFGPGELAAHMSLGVDQRFETLGQGLLARIKDQEAALATASAVERAYVQLKAFGERCGLGSDVSIRTVSAHHATVKHTQEEARQRLASTESELKALEAQGLSYAELQTASKGLADLRFRLSAATSEGAEKLVSDIAAARSEADTALQTQGKLADEQEASLQATLATATPGIEPARLALSQARERLTATNSFLNQFKPFSTRFSWPPASPIADLVIAARSTRTVASELQTALGRERSDTTSQAQAVKRKEQLDRRAADVSQKVKKFSDAHSAIEKLMRNHSLNSAMQTALRQNRAAIESIFARIHSPAEFSGLGKKFDGLVRRDDGNEASLSEISTGQRAAFALSIFLAQNSQLTAAPPVMLIDDPIAHVDDLNSLSFLDYLREISIRGQRQIFFATANDKIASLFERKFDFLGENDFRKVELTRE